VAVAAVVVVPTEIVVPESMANIGLFHVFFVIAIAVVDCCFFFSLLLRTLSTCQTLLQLCLLSWPV